MKPQQKSKPTVSTTIRFVQERDTKRTVRFMEIVPASSTPRIGTLYVQKSCMEELGNPEKLAVTLTVE